MPAYTDFDKRMKNYERRNSYYLQQRLPVVIRCDMRAGHTYTRGFKRPFDEIFIKTMQETAKYLCQNVQNSKLSYQQSDEISLVLVDYEKLNTDSWFNYRVDKLCSITASMTTMAFNKFMHKNISDLIWKGKNTYTTIYDNALKKGAIFDARVFNLPKEEVCNYFYWRQLDASRNSIQMVGLANFSHKELQNKSRGEIQDMLMTQKGVNWNDFPSYQKRGSCCIKEKYFQTCEEGQYINLPDGCCDPYEDKESENGTWRTRWIIDKDIPIFKGEHRKYIEEIIDVGEYE